VEWSGQALWFGSVLGLGFIHGGRGTEMDDLADGVCSAICSPVYRAVPEGHASYGVPVLGSSGMYLRGLNFEGMTFM
jgi:hypothetical protein